MISKVFCCSCSGIFQVSIAIPTEAPSLGKSTEDGPGTTIVGYFKMKESTRAILQRITADGYDSTTDKAESGVDEQKQITNGVRLWEEVRHCIIMTGMNS